MWSNRNMELNEQPDTQLPNPVQTMQGHEGFLSPQDHFIRSMPGVSLAHIAKAWRMGANTVMAYAQGENWAKLRGDYRAKLELAVTRKTIAHASDTISEMNRRHRKMWRRFTAEVTAVFVSVQEARKADPSVTIPMTTLEKMANVLTKAQVGERLSWGLTLDQPAKEDAPKDNTARLLTAIYDNAAPEERESMRMAAIAMATAQARIPESEQAQLGTGDE